MARHTTARWNSGLLSFSFEGQCFFFEKKKQKTFMTLRFGRYYANAPAIES
jgi:hypothetical protein